MLFKYLYLLLFVIINSCANIGEIGEKKITKFHEHPSYIIVSKGDNLRNISMKYHVKIKDLIKINNLTTDTKLKIGQKIKLPKNKYYIIQKNDNLEQIAKKFDIDMGLIASLNDINYPFKLKPGNILKIPINEIYKREQEALAKIDNKIYDFVEIPIIKNKPDSLNNDNPQTFDIKEYEENLEEIKQDDLMIDDIIMSQEKSPINTDDLNSSKYIWPVEGKIISFFDQTTTDEINDGINIETPSHSSVKAIASGIVAYSGIGPEGYGQLIIIKHEDNIFSAYANLQDIFVKKEEKISKAQEIARLGVEENLISGKLYFALRIGEINVNPLLYLPKID